MLLLLAVLLAVQAARLVWAVLVPLAPVGDWRAAAAQYPGADQRAGLLASFDAFFRSPAGAGGEVAVTSLDLTLFGTSVNEASGGGSAILAGADGVQASFSVGDEVLPGVVLAAVAFDNVALDRAGVRETLFLNQSEPVAAATPDLPAQPGDAPALTPAALRAGISFAPRSEGGKVTGVVVQPQSDGAVFRAAGLQAGDVIRAVNGRAVGAAADLAGLLAPGARLGLEVERGSAVVPVALVVSE